MKQTSSKQAFSVGIIIFLGTLIGTFLIGQIYSDTQARAFIEAMAPSLRTLCFAAITASATVISLLLTTIGFAHRLDNDFDQPFYHQIKLIARLCSLSLIIAVSILLVLTMPVTESDALRTWFSLMYYTLIVFSAALAALIVSIIILLYRTIDHIIYVVYPG